MRSHDRCCGRMLTWSMSGLVITRRAEVQGRHASGMQALILRGLGVGWGAWVSKLRGYVDFDCKMLHSLVQSDSMPEAAFECFQRRGRHTF